MCRAASDEKAFRGLNTINVLSPFLSRWMKYVVYLTSSSVLSGHVS